MKSFRRRLVPMVILVSLALLLGACGGETPTAGSGDTGQAEIETDQPTATEPASPSPAGESPLPTEAPEAQTGVRPLSPVPIEITPVEPAARTGEVPQDLLQAVIEDLLGRLGVSREAIEVEEAGAVVWPDGSLGCPQPGMMYTQALVSGYQIVLQVGEDTYDYHASGRGYFVLCEEDMAEEPLPPGEGSVQVVKPGLEPSISQAKSDLARKLSIGADQIEVLEARAMVWPDASLGCPQPGMEYKQVPVDGALILLTANGKVYEYHTDRNEVVIACDTPVGLRPIPLPPKSADDRTPWQPVDDPTVITP